MRPVTMHNIMPISKKQSGNVYLILLVAVACVLAAWQYSESRDSKRLAANGETTKSETAQRELEQKALEDRQKQVEHENDALKKSMAGLRDIESRWKDARRVATASSRIALSGPVASLQAIRREADTLVVPPCADLAKSELLKSMGFTVDAFFSFMREEGEMANILAGALLDDADKAYKSYEQGLTACPKAP